MGRQAINALCLTFENVTLLPHRDRLHDVALYVPAYSVARIGDVA